MKISAKQYAQALLDIIDDKEDKELDASIKSFASVLKNNNQLNQLDKILYYFKKLYNQKHNIVEATISSAQALDKEVVSQVEKYVKDIKKEESVEFKTDIKKNIIGGIVIKYGDKIIDSSLKTRLNQLKNSLLK